MAENDLAIVAHGLTKRFGDFTAVDAIDLAIPRGEIFGLLGPNGAGKTTTIRMMLGLLEPTSGEVRVLGVPVDERAAEIRSRIGYMAQSFSLYDDLTVLQNLRFYGRAYGIPKRELRARIEAALQRTDLEGRGSVTTKALSGGWRQRLALNAAILHRPELIFLDEPTAGVDPSSRRAFWDLLYELVGEGITVLVTTHYMEEAEHCHRLAFLQHGRVIAQGTPREIKRDEMAEQVIEIGCDQPNRAITILQELDELNEVTPYGAKIHAIAREPAGLEGRIRALLEQEDIEVREVATVEPSLEDVFISKMKAPPG
jgi:ABC-2 type transport system ATP-binding protein